jgi:hypothetical protein
MADTDDQLLERLFARLTEMVTNPEANPYRPDGKYAEAIKQLPTGLGAMAATHYLDFSLAIDDIGWHFLNFGEQAFVKETESGLRVLGLAPLANWFSEASDLVVPLKPEIHAEGGDYYECIQRHGYGQRLDELQEKAESLEPKVTGSAVYAAWVKYAREHAHEVFGG